MIAFFFHTPVKEKSLAKKKPLAKKLVGAAF